MARLKHARAESYRLALPSDFPINKQSLARSARSMPKHTLSPVEIS